MLAAMTIRKMLPSALLAVLLVSGIQAATPAPTAPATPDPKAGKASSDPVSTLTQGLAAEAVRKIMGAPDEIKPMKAPNGKAETWVYSHELGQRVEQFLVPTPDVIVSVTDSKGGGHQLVTPGHPETREIRYAMVERIEVLMFNDHYVMHKVSRFDRKI